MTSPALIRVASWQFFYRLLQACGYARSGYPSSVLSEIDAVDLDFAAANNLSLRLLAKYSQGRK